MTGERAALRTQKGMALIAVLWLVAAMGLIITGIVKSVRSEIQTVGQQRHTLVANALADAAIMLALQSLPPIDAESGGIQVVPVKFQDISYQVTIQPLNGHIDINNAKLSLLVDMYRHAGGLSPEEAQTLAQATVDFRQTKNAQGATQGFDSVEDMLDIPQMNYDLYAKIFGLVTADIKEGSGRVNVLGAPHGVLRVLSGGDSAKADSLIARRTTDGKAADTSALNPEHVEMTASPGLKLQAQVNLPDGSATQRNWLIHKSADPRSGLPWRMLGTQQSRQTSATLSP